MDARASVRLPPSPGAGGPPKPTRPFCALGIGQDESVTRAFLDKRPHDVAEMFDGVARRYDLTNTVLSGGMDRGWRRATVAALALGPRDTVLDLAAGTAVSTVQLGSCGATAVACDFSLGMLKAGKARGRHVPMVAGDALRASVRGRVVRRGDDRVRAAQRGRRGRGAARAGPGHQAGRPAGGLRVQPADVGAVADRLHRVPDAGAAGRGPPGVQQPGRVRLPRRVDPGLAGPARRWPGGSRPPAGSGCSGAT